MNVYKKLQQARLKLQQAPLKKSGKNKFAGYEYFELADFLPTIQTIFAEVGLCGTVSFGTEIASLTIVDVDGTDSTQPNSVVFCSPMSTAELKGCHAIQNLGAVQTYLRRYLWVTAMEIVEHDALDAVTGSDSKKAEPTLSSQRLVGVDKKGWQLAIDAYKEGDDLQSWLNSVQSEVHHILDTWVQTTGDLLLIFTNNKVIFDEVQKRDQAFFVNMMKKFTEVKNKLEEKTNG
jgi:hypothetical protein